MNKAYLIAAALALASARPPPSLAEAPVLPPISGGHAENALPQRAKATVQCRMMPGDDADRVERQLIDTLQDPGIGPR